MAAKSGNFSSNILDNIVIVASLKNDTYGTGFFISPYGHILTNSHVIGDGKSFQLCYRAPIEQGGVICDDSDKLKILATNNNLDLALLQLSPIPNSHNNNYLTFGNSDLSKVGDAVNILGYPSADLVSLKLSQGLISESTPNYVFTGARVLHGNSGSPVFNSRNEVIGIAARTFGVDFNDKGVVIPSNLVTNWLRDIQFYSKGASVFFIRDKNFSINFPGKPRFLSSVQQTTIGKMTLNSYFYKKNKREMFIVNYGYLTEEQLKKFNSKENLKEILTNKSTESIDEIIVDKQHHSISYKEKTTQGYFIIGKIYINKNEFYDIIVLKKNSRPDDKETNSFISSFQLL